MHVAKADLPVLYVRFLDLAPRASGESPTERSLKVAELDDGDGCIGIALEVAGLSHHGVHQRCCGWSAGWLTGLVRGRGVTCVRRRHASFAHGLGGHQRPAKKPTNTPISNIASPTSTVTHRLFRAFVAPEVEAMSSFPSTFS